MYVVACDVATDRPSAVAASSHFASAAASEPRLSTVIAWPAGHEPEVPDGVLRVEVVVDAVGVRDQDVVGVDAAAQEENDQCLERALRLLGRCAV